MDSTTQLRLQRNQDVAVVIKLEPANSSKDNFDNLLVEAVDSAFSMLGDLAKQAIYLHLKNSFGVCREEIPYQIEDFVNALEQIFGPGALLLETRILENLHNKVPIFRVSSKKEELFFLDYLKYLRKFL
ncbi:MAG TPA: hypothetical protein VK253_02430 [Candidatus Binatia bacterium]|nr:hypothetical protein [Candidatus Binatia bacterium]